MDKYTKIIEVKPVLEEISTKNSLQVAVDGFFSRFQEKTKSNVDVLKEKLSSLKDDMENLEFAKSLSDERLKTTFDLDELDKENEYNKKLTEEMKVLTKVLEQTKKELSFEKGKQLGLRAQEFTNKIEEIGKKSVSFINDLGTDAIDFISGLAENAIKEIKNMASYSLSTSLTINQEARDLALQYGLSDAQTYAYSKVKDEMGIQSEEDIWLMTPAQRERFAERIGYYSGEYNKLANKGFFESYERFRAAFTDFKTELQMKVIEFFTRNEDLIINSLEMGVDVLGKILDAISWINKVTGPTEKTSLSDVINNYSNSSKNTNIKVDNTFNGVSVNDQMKLRQIGNELNRTLLNQIDNI